MEKLNELSDEQVDTELKTLQTKADATKEEKDKVQALKEERATRYQKRLDKLTWEKKTEAEKSARLEAELRTQREELDRIKSEQHQAARPVIIEEYVEFGGKKYYTDKALVSMVENKELDPQQAYAHQQQRMKAEIKSEIEMETKQRESSNKNAKIWEEDKETVLKEYPNFNPNNPNHDPNDPLFKLASEICREDFMIDGQFVNPRALSLSIKRAKQILKTTDTRPDVSEEHTVSRPGSSSSITRQETPLSQIETDTAVRLYKDVINPATNKTYTEQEAIAKALKAKRARGR